MAKSENTVAENSAGDHRSQEMIKAKKLDSRPRPKKPVTSIGGVFVKNDTTNDVVQ